MDSNQQPNNNWQAPGQAGGPNWQTPNPNQAGFGAVVPVAKKNRGCLKAFLIALALGVIAVVVGGFFIFKATAGSEKEARKFVEAVVSDDVDAAYALTSTAFRESSSKEDVQAIIDDQLAPVADGNVSNTGRNIVARTGSPTTAVDTYSIEKGDTKLYARVTLQKQGGKWKVVNFQTSAESLSTEVGS